MKKWISCSLIVVVIGMSVSCGHSLHLSEQFQSAIKSWCLTIRANQIIPVYPLTNNLQPGDIYLIDSPVENELRTYKQLGFLPLEKRITTVSGVQRFENPARMGHAAFLRYTENAYRRGEMSFALPLHAVPVGLDLLGSNEAQTTVSIENAQTYGIDIEKLYEAVRSWVQDHQDFAKKIFSSRGRQVGLQFRLRVIDQVYLAGSMNVSMQSQHSSSATISGGFPKNNIEQLDAQVQERLPGGSVKVVSATERSVGMIEKFNPPLVFGYTAIDIVIDENGSLGSPHSTRGVIQGEERIR